ncbi:hypothetical protein LB505_003035 [Fusarium chuoi]|nr:hypothetical protein LB505_003035 [Fusarium chuoi]
MEEIDTERESVWNRLSKIYETSKEFVSSREVFTTPWQSLKSPESLKNHILPPATTAIDQTTVEQVATKALSRTIPCVLQDKTSNEEHSHSATLCYMTRSLASLGHP